MSSGSDVAPATCAWTRRAWPVVAAALLLVTACGTTVVRQVQAGDRALTRGDYRAAEQAYDRALRLDPDEEGRGAWARAKIEAGRGKIRILRMKRERPWEQLTGAPTTILEQLHRWHVDTRLAGGDAELEATLDRLSNDIARTHVAGLEAAAAERLHPSAVAATALPAYGYLDPAVIARAMALVTRGREAAELAAVGVGDRPLARRVYQAMATRLGGAPLDDAAGLTLPFGQSVRRTTSGVDCGGLLAGVEPASTVATRQAEVQVTFDSCGDDVGASTSTEELRWTVDVVAGYRSETRSYQTCTSTPTNYYQCYGGVCSYSGSLSKETCRTNTETVQIPIIEAVPVTGTRTVTRHRGRQSVTGRWTVRRGDRTWNGTFGTTQDVDVSEAPAYEHFPAYRSGPLPSFADRRAAAAAQAQAAIDVALTAAFRPEIDEAERVARRLEGAGDPAAADEAWVIAALLGGDRPGTWARHGLSADELRGAFTVQAAATIALDEAATALPAARVFDIPPLPRRTPQDLVILQQRLVGPLGKAASARAYTGWQAVPEVTSAQSPDTLAGQGFLTFGGIVESQGLLSRRRRSQLGVGLVDGVAGFLGGGMAVSQPEAAFGSSSLLRAGASYSAGLALRRAGSLGLLAGLRADGEWFLLGSASGWHARVGGFARLELLRLDVPWTFAVQGEAVDLVGDPLLSGELFLARVKKDGWQRMSRFVSLRYERRAIDAGVTVTGTSEVESPTLAVEDLEVTSWTVSVGLGF